MACVNDEMRSRAFGICQLYLGGSWVDATLDQFEIEHISGGLSNLLYCCSLSKSVDLCKGEIRKAMLRLYGQIIQANPEMVVTDSVIFALLAEKGHGPKLHGVFTGGRVEEYIDSRHLRTCELRDAEISVACARVMARFHKLNMPLCKQPTWLFSIMKGYLSDALEVISGEGMDVVRSPEMQTLLSYRLQDELENLRNILAQVHSPVVFCHNDLQEGNILYSQAADDTASWQLMPIDFEYASYNYRGFDIANHFCEWCYDYSNTEPPYFTGSLQHWPTRQQQLLFVRAYLDAGSTSGGDRGDTHEEEEAILLELNTYALASHFLWALWAVVQTRISDIKFGYLEYAMVRFDAYFKQKEALLNKPHVNGS